MSWGADFFSWYHDNGILPNLWKGATGQLSAEKQNDQNLQFQRERAEIEDARYEDETAYNRAWQEEARDYDRALQQTIFDREDTAYSRAAQDASSVGINPLSLSGGVNAGEAIASQPAPQPSQRQAQAPQSDVDYASFAPINAIAPVMSLFQGIGEQKTGVLERDALQEQIDYQKLKNQGEQIDNAIKASEYGITINDDGSLTVPKFDHTKQEHNEVEYRNANASANRNERVDEYQDKYKVNDTSTPQERIVTGIQNQLDNGFIGRSAGTLNNVLGSSDSPSPGSDGKGNSAVDGVTDDAMSVMLQQAQKKLNQYQEKVGQKWNDFFNPKGKRTREAHDKYYNDYVKRYMR